MEAFWEYTGKETNDGLIPVWKCSACGASRAMNRNFLFTFCPSCGAKMDKDFSQDEIVRVQRENLTSIFDEMVREYLKIERELENIQKKQEYLKRRLAELEKNMKRAGDMLRSIDGDHDGGEA